MSAYAGSLSENTTTYGFLSNIMSDVEKLRLCISLMGEVDRIFCCGNFIDIYSPGGAKETMKEVIEKIKLENCILGDIEETLLLEAIPEEAFPEMASLEFGHRKSKGTSAKEALRHKNQGVNRLRKYEAINETKKKLGEKYVENIEQLEIIKKFEVNEIPFAYMYNDYYKLKEGPDHYAKKVKNPFNLERTFDTMVEKDLDVLILGESEKTPPYIASMDKNGNVTWRYVYENSNGDGKQIISDDGKKHIIGAGSVKELLYPHKKRNASLMSWGKITSKDKQDIVVELFVKSVNDN